MSKYSIDTIRYLVRTQSLYLANYIAFYLKLTQEVLEVHGQFRVRWCRFRKMKTHKNILMNVTFIWPS